MPNVSDDFIFSQSSLQNYVDCPRRFQLKYLDQVRYPAPEVDDMLSFEQRMMQGKRFHHLVHQHLLGISPDILQARIHDPDVARWFTAYLQSGTDNLPPTYYPEQTLTVNIGDYALLAKFDLIAIGKRAVIVDWKTSRKLPRRDWLAHKLQTIVYRYVLARGGNRLNAGTAIAPEAIDMRYWFADHDGQTIDFTYDDAQFQADEAYLLGLMQAIDRSTEFPKTDDERLCLFCSYRSLCERGTSAGTLEAWDGLDYDADDLTAFEIDIDQIAEIEF